MLIAPQPLPGQRVRYPHPAGILIGSGAVAIPVELEFDPAEVVGIDFFAGGADHDRRSAARQSTAMASSAAGRNCVAAGITLKLHSNSAPARCRHCEVVVGGEIVRNDQVFLVQPIHRVVDELELEARSNTFLDTRLHDSIHTGNAALPCGSPHSSSPHDGSSYSPG